ITLGMPKSVITSVNTTSAALIRPYLAPGRVTVRKTRSLRVPKTSAASYRRASAGGGGRARDQRGGRGGGKNPAETKAGETGKSAPPTPPSQATVSENA